MKDPPVFNKSPKQEPQYKETRHIVLKWKQGPHVNPWCVSVWTPSNSLLSHSEKTSKHKPYPETVSKTMIEKTLALCNEPPQRDGV